MGGNGVFMGLSVIFASGLIGLFWRWFRPRWKEKYYALELLVMGLTVHLAMLALTVLLPKDSIISTMKVIAFPLLFLYSPATMLLGILMLGQWKNYQTLKMKDKLQEAEMRLNKELVIAKEKAEESDRLKSSFLANLSHEIRTPMNAILGFTDLLKESDLSAEKREHYGNIIRKGGQHLISIIDDIIEISKIETNQVKPHFSKVDLHRLLNEVKQLVSVNLPKDKEIEIRLAIPSGNEKQILQTDEVKLKQILINLINNAIKFTEKGWVEFGYEYDSQIIFYVSDTGIGIDKEHHEIIFDRFRQVESDTSILKGGSGLGLAITKGYVEMLGGSISLESEYGKGSVFRFTIPVKSQ
jgi:signal transduction histidine kinase